MAKHLRWSSGLSLRSACLVLCLLACLASCGPEDPRKAELDQAMLLMTSIIKSRVLLDAVRNADPQMHASTAAGAALTGGVTANFPLPPPDITLLDATQTPQAWSVLIRADDTQQQVILEGYGEDLQQPLVTETIGFPPS